MSEQASGASHQSGGMKAGSLSVSDSGSGVAAFAVLWFHLTRGFKLLVHK